MFKTMFPGAGGGVGGGYIGRLGLTYIHYDGSVHAQLCLTLCNPTDCSPPDSSVHGILQARVLEWGAIAFSVFIL